MKKQDNESLIQEIQKRLDWYTMEASDEEFDADEVQNLLKLNHHKICRKEDHCTSKVSGKYKNPHMQSRHYRSLDHF